MVVCLAAMLVTSQEAAFPEQKSGETGEQHQEGGERYKRSGDLIGYIGGKLHSKITAIASASAGLSSLSAASKPEYGPPVSHERINKRRTSSRSSVLTEVNPMKKYNSTYEGVFKSFRTES